MDGAKRLVLKCELEGGVADQLEGKTFQVHVKPGGVLLLYPVEVMPPPPEDRRCRVLISGEQCGKNAGHEGKHQWSGGD